MDAQEWLNLHGAKLESPWERLFVEQVLNLVPGLDFLSVATQWNFPDVDGHQRRADFVIEDDRGVRIAIEVKGFSTPTGPRDFVVDAKKALSLRLTGWVVLDFANSLFGWSTWIPGEPPGTRPKGARLCAQLIEREMNNAHVFHDLKARQADARASQRERDQMQAAMELLAKTVEQQRLERNRAVAELAAAEEQNRELATKLAAAQTAREPEANAHDLAKAQEAVKVLTDAVEARDRQAEEELNALRRKLEEGEKERGDNLKLALFGMVAVCVAAIVVVVWLAERSDTGGDPTPTAGVVEGAAGTATPDPCTGVVPWDRAHACDGRTASVVGPVVGARFQEGTNGQPTYLNIGEDFPNPNRVSVVIWGNCRGNFEVGPETMYLDRRIVVTAKVEQFQDVTQIEVCRPGQITLDGS